MIGEPTGEGHTRSLLGPVGGFDLYKFGRLVFDVLGIEPTGGYRANYCREARQVVVAHPTQQIEDRLQLVPCERFVPGSAMARCLSLCCHDVPPPPRLKYPDEGYRRAITGLGIVSIGAITTVLSATAASA